MGHPAEREKGRKYVGLPEFALAGERVLSRLDLEQERGTVTTVPDERTIRYYLAEGLIVTPGEKQGTASVFEYLNLLQLVAIKKLQAEHLPIRKIRELVAGRSEQELESLLGIGGASGSGTSAKENEAKRYLESLLAPTLSKSSSAGESERAAGRVTQPMRAAGPEPLKQSETSLSWQRVEIEPGLELHIRSDYSRPSNAKTRSLAEKIRSVIRRYWEQ